MAPPRSALLRSRWTGIIALLCLLQIISSQSVRAASDPAKFNTHFVAVAFHDVVDRGQAADGVSLGKLIDFFERLKQDGWQPVSSADIEAATTGRRALPPKAILLSFDDGYASFYGRVYPLLLAYRYPALLALVGEWMDTPPGATVDYGGKPIPRDHFVTWDQVRRMQASGLVEVASHSYALHRSVPINRQGNMAPAGRSWIYEQTRGAVETDDAHRQRIRADLMRSRDAITRETGQVPHVLVWPFGRYSGLALQEARAIGFDQIFTLEPAAADARRPFEIPRYYPTRDPDLGEILENIEFKPEGSPIRAACVDLAPIVAAGSPEEQDVRLGGMIEDLRRLGPNIAIIDAFRIGPDGEPVASRVPTRLLPVESDVLSRVARQLGTRADVDVYVRLPLAATVKAFGESGAIELVQQIVRAAPITGLALDDSSLAANPVAEQTKRADVRAMPASAEENSSLAMRIMRTARAMDPQLRVIIVSDSEGTAPPDGADMIVWPPASDARDAAARAAGLRRAGWFAPRTEQRIVLGMPRTDPADQIRSIRDMQGEGATAIALCPWAPADTDALAGVFSAATFPRRP